MHETTSTAAPSTAGAQVTTPRSWLRRAARGVGVAIVVGGAAGVVVRLVMRVVAMAFDHEPSMSIPGTAAIVLLFAIGFVPAAVLLALGWRRTGLVVLVATTLTLLSQIVVVGLDEGAAALLEEPSPLNLAIIAAFLLTPPVAALGIWRLISTVTRADSEDRAAAC